MPTRKKPTVSTAAVVRDCIDTHLSIKDGMRMMQRPRKAPAVPRGVLRTPTHARSLATAGGA